MDNISSLLIPIEGFRISCLSGGRGGGGDLQGREFEWNNKCNQNSCVTRVKAMSRHSFTSSDVWSLLRLISFRFQHLNTTYAGFSSRVDYRSSSILSSLRVCSTNQTPKCWNFAFILDIFKDLFNRRTDCSEVRERLQLVSSLLCTKVASVNTVNSTVSRWSVTAGDLTSCRTQPKQTVCIINETLYISHTGGWLVN